MVVRAQHPIGGLFVRRNFGLSRLFKSQRIFWNEMPFSRKRVRSSSRVRRFRPRAARASRMRRPRARLTRRVNSDIHWYNRWSIPSTFSTVTRLGGLNFQSTQWSYSTATGLLTTANSTSVNQLPFSFQASFDQVTGVGDFANLYDQYCIKMVVFYIKMVNVPDTATVPNSSTTNQYANFYPTIWYVKDDDDVLLMDLVSIREHGRVKHKVLRPNKELKIVFRPKILTQLWNGPADTAYEIKKPRWVDMVNGGLPHFGIKSVIDFEGLDIPIATVANQYRFKLNVKYYFGCKHVR